MIYHREEHPLPHFHAKYGEHKVSIAIETLEILTGGLPGLQLAKVKKWAKTHKKQLLTVWELAKNNKPLPKLK